MTELSASVPSSRAEASQPAWVRRSLVLGSTLGLLETSFVYATGFAPIHDFLLIWICDLALCLAWGAGLAAGVAAVGRVGRRSFPVHGRLRDLGLLLFPALLFGLRGNVDPSQVNHPWATPARWGVTLAVILVVVADALTDREHLNEPMSLALFAMVAWLSALAVVTGFAMRTLDFTATRDIVAANPFGRAAISTVALCLSAFLIWRISRQEAHEGSGREWIGILGFFVISIGLALSLGSQPPKLGPPVPSATDRPKAGGPNVLLVVLDTVRQDHVSAYGYRRRTTPNLDDFTQGAIVFETARAAATYSLSTHASLFTGLLPSVHGAHPIPPGAMRDEAQNPGHYRLRRSVDTLAEELLGQGYLTAGISGNDVFLARWTGLQRGFSRFVSETRRWYRFVPTVTPILSRLGGPHAFPTRSWWAAERITEGAVQWLAQTGGRPFFLFLNYLDAHHPYHAPRPYDQLFPVSTGDRTAQWISQYDGAIAYVDAWLGRLLRRLQEKGLFEDTLIIVTSDHGEFFGEHGLFLHGDFLYEPVLRVPLIVKLPKQQTGLRSAARVGQWQVREVVQRVLGEGITPEKLVAGLDAPGPKLMAESWSPGPGAAPLRLAASKPRSRAVYIGPYKLVERAGAADWLFHLGNDPREENELSSQDPQLLRALRLRARQAVGPLEDSAEDPELPEIDEAVLEKLRSLGYLNVSRTRTGAPSR